MATAAAIKGPKEFIFLWEGKDRAGKIIRGELRAVSETAVNATLRRQGILVQKVKKQRIRGGGRVSEKDLALFTRQLATMMKAGVPLLQAFDIVGKGASNPAVQKLLLAIKTEVETGSSLAAAFRKYPLYFDALYCNLVQAGEQAVHHLPRDHRRYLRLPSSLEAFARGADLHGPADAAHAGVRGPRAQVDHRALDSDARHDVRGRRAAGRGT